MANDGPLPKVLVVGGPTASGKSALACMLADRLGGVIINADSLQLYRGLPILTASPDAGSMALYPHRLYGVLAPDEISTAAWWANKARAAIDEALALRRVPIVVGGTGLYIEALVSGMASIPAVPDGFREGILLQLAEMGNAAFHAMLVRADPEAAHLKPGDTHRIVRAWAVFSYTGRSLFDWQRDAPPASCYDFTCISLVPERTGLYAACDSRFLRMIEHGAQDEVRRFLEHWPENIPAARALGFRELSACLRGELDPAQAIELAQADTRHYAKRQTTWFRNRFMRLPGARMLAQPPGAAMADDIARGFTAN